MPSHEIDRSRGKDYNGEFSMEKLDRSKRILCEFVSGFPSEKLLIAYSGGKDSIVVAHLAAQLGISDSICEISYCSPLQVADFKKTAHQLGLNVTYKDSLNWEWLAKHPKWIHGSLKEAGGFYSLRQQKTIKRHAINQAYKGVIYGRRTEENTVRAPIYQTKDGLNHCHPIRDWRTAEVWAYIHKHGIHYPGIYDHPIGKKEGNTPLNRLPKEHWPNPWKVLHSYDPNYVQNFAPFNADARAFLASL